jgi:sugar phosphate isomerase/epimerase
MTNQICVQEQHLPGDSVEEKWEAAQAWGYDGIELRGKGEGAFLDRLPDLRRAVRAGAVLPTVCVEMPHFIGAFDPDLRRDAVEQLTQQLTVMAEIGGRGAMTPASWGMFSTRLPPFTPPRPPEEDRAVLLDGLGRLADHADRLGVEIYLEPLNRYEDHMVNTLGAAASLVAEIGRRSLRIAADTYHMNIEERDPARALLDAAEYIGHIQASDSNRLEPGAGHLDWALFGSTVRAAGYRGPNAVESRLSGPGSDVLPRVPSLLRRYL